MKSIFLQFKLSAEKNLCLLILLNNQTGIMITFYGFLEFRFRLHFETISAQNLFFNNQIFIKIESSGDTIKKKQFRFSLENLYILAYKPEKFQASRAYGSRDTSRE